MARGTVSGADGVMKALSAQMAKLGGGTVQVGFPEGAKYPDGTPVAQAAWWAEYGHGGPFPAPPRPYFRGMIAKDSPGWADSLAGALKFAGGNTTQALGLMGQKISGQLRDSIVDYSDVPLSNTTLRLREKFGTHRDKINASEVIKAQDEAAQGYPLATGTLAKPLVLTGDMLRGVGYQVNNGEVKS